MMRKLVLVVLVACSLLYSDAAINCQQGGGRGFCESVVAPGSVCNSNGVCSNPYESGCLRSKLGSDIFSAKRACNSDDPPEALEQGLCEASPFNYTEIRVHNANWESSIFYSWIIQVLLSEMLHVPVTIGLGPGTIENSFYDPNNRFTYSPSAYNYDALRVANANNGDCTQTLEECIHVMPEVWNGQVADYTAEMAAGVIDPVEGDGQVGKISWHIPRFTAERYPEFVSFYGLSGEQNRETLARIFKRPTTWKTYCDQVSPNRCSLPDDVALRYPLTEESDSYFQGDLYTGFFRATAENNCTTNAECTGHIVAPPCTWSSFIDSQLFWNDIAMKSNGDDAPNDSYSYGEMIAIWKAANATKSDVLMWWFTPDATVELFRDSEAEFQPILLPEPTASCRDNRISSDARCTLDETVRQGEPEGSCDSEAHALQKVIASSLRESTLSQPIGQRSPGYQTIRNFKISDLDMDVLLRNWISLGGDDGFNGREAVCNFVAENYEALQAFIPPGFPRILSSTDQYNSGFLIAVQILGACAAVLVSVACGVVYYFRQTRVFVFAQVNFVLLLMVGMLLVSLGAIVFSIRPTKRVCVLRLWFVYLGYTWELIPLLVKLSAINRVLHSAKRMKRVKISVRNMFIKVAALIGAVIMFLTIWEVLDAPLPVEELVLSNEQGNLVISELACRSSSQAWIMASFGWIALLLVMATVLAFQTRQVAQEFNESQSLGTMIYSHFLFMLLRSAIAALEVNDVFSADWAAGATSLLLSLDVIFALGIYILPKLVAARHNPEVFDRDTSSGTPRQTTGGGGSARRITSGLKGKSPSQAAGPARSFVASMQSIEEADSADEEDTGSDREEQRPPTRSTSAGPIRSMSAGPISSGRGGGRRQRSRMRELEGEFEMFKKVTRSDH